MDLFKKESAGLSGAIEDAVSGVVPGRSILETPKATYLDGYGAVISLEASLEPTRSPFNSPKSPAEVRATVSERRKGIQKKLETLLKQRVAAMQSVMPTDSVTFVLYIANSNPAMFLIFLLRFYSRRKSRPFASQDPAILMSASAAPERILFGQLLRGRVLFPKKISITHWLFKKSEKTSWAAS